MDVISSNDKIFTYLLSGHFISGQDFRILTKKIMYYYKDMLPWKVLHSCDFNKEICIQLLKQEK
jgi:hypothetical protein